MHWIDRGPEPDALAAVRERYTSRWIRHYRDGVGKKPGDAHWQDFRDDLHKVFHGLCAYCETRGKGQIDHFCPKSRFPEFVYQWSNWLWACADCNLIKRDKWPETGYVDPCAESTEERPEAYFTFDTLTCEILPLKDLSPERHDRAAAMIQDLNLNGRHHLRNRRETVECLIYLADVSVPEDHNSQERLAKAFALLVLAKRPHSSIIRVWLHEQGYTLHDG